MDPYNYEVIESTLKVIKLSNETTINYNLDQVGTNRSHGGKSGWWLQFSFDNGRITVAAQCYITFRGKE